MHVKYLFDSIFHIKPLMLLKVLQVVCLGKVLRIIHLWFILQVVFPV